MYIEEQPRPPNGDQPGGQLMKHAILPLFWGLVLVSALSCEQDNVNCSLDTLMQSISECEFEEICDIQTTKKNDFEVTITQAACVPNEGMKEPGAACKKDGQCKNGVCIDGTCLKVCFKNGVKCGSGTQCVFSGGITTQDKRHQVGYCAKKADCIKGEEPCDEGDECRYLINNAGIPKADTSYGTGCTPPLGDKSDGDSCDFSDECKAPLICSNIPGLEDSEQICRKVCESSAICGESRAGEWCSTDLEGNGHFQFEVKDKAMGVCTENPSDPAEEEEEEETGNGEE